MPDEFRSFAQLLVQSPHVNGGDAAHAPAIPFHCDDDGDAIARTDADNVDAGGVETRDDIVALAREVRWFRALVAERFDACVERLLKSFASDVLARECVLASTDLETLAVSILERETFAEPLAIAVHPNEPIADAIAGIPVRRDACVELGALRFICANGEATSTLAVRLDAAIRAVLCEP